MTRKPIVLTALALASLLAALPSRASDPKRPEQTAHIHGEARLQLVQEDATLKADLDIPGVDVVGFERAPSGPIETAAVASAESMLAQADDVVELLGPADCKLDSAEAKFETGGGDAHDGHESGEESHHGTFEATYVWSCAAPAKLEGLALRIFDRLPSLQSVHVEFATGSGQGSAVAAPGSAAVRF